MSVLFFNLPAFIQQLDLSKSSSVGDSLGGITAPVIGIISSVLLYLALTKQVDSNNDQKLKNESDIIFSLINQYQKEVDSFYYKYSRSNQEYIYRGLEGLNKFSNDFPGYSFRTHNFTFEVYFEARQLLLLCRSFKLIERRIQVSPMDSELKLLFVEKLDMIFECILYHVFFSVTTTLEKNDKMIDNSAREIIDFFKSHNKHNS